MWHCIGDGYLKFTTKKIAESEEIYLDDQQP